MSRQKLRESARLGATQIQGVAELFGVLADPTRLRILQLLHGGPASVTEIMERAGLKQANASKQLGMLHRCGVLAREREGNVVRYSIRMPLVLELCDLVCARLKEDADAVLKLMR